MTTASGPPDPPDPPGPPDPPDPSGTAESGPTDEVARDSTDDAGRHPTAELPPEHPPGFGQAPPGYGQSPPGGYGQPPPGYGPPPPPPSTPRLQRSSSDKVLTGVCGGLGRHTGVDPILFRIGFVALVFAAGTGILLYLALAVLMPRDDGQQIWSRASGRVPAPDAGGYGPPTRPPNGPHTGQQTAPAYGLPSAPPVPKGPRSPVPGVTLAVLLIGFGVLALGRRYGDWSLDPSAYVAIALAVVGIALLVSAFGPWRRSKGGLIVLGLILSLALFATSAFDGRGSFGERDFGDRNYRPAALSQVRETYQVVMGESVLDLTGVQPTSGDPIEIQINVTIGSFVIVVPADADVELSGDAVFGSVSAFGDRNIIDGFYPGAGNDPLASDDEAEIILDFDVRFGNAEVSRGR